MPSPAKCPFSPGKHSVASATLFFLHFFAESSSAFIPFRNHTSLVISGHPVSQALFLLHRLPRFTSKTLNRNGFPLFTSTLCYESPSSATLFHNHSILASTSATVLCAFSRAEHSWWVSYPVPNVFWHEVPLLLYRMLFHRPDTRLWVSYPFSHAASPSPPSPALDHTPPSPPRPPTMLFLRRR